MRYLLATCLAALGCAAPDATARPSRQADAPVAGERSLDVGGTHRTYALHVPANAHDRMPLVIVLHGGFGNGRQSERKDGFDAVADREGFAVAYPDGLERHWNDGRIDNGATAVDDVAFVRTLIDELVAHDKIDPARVFVTGMSNGGMMTYRLGCELADKIAAIAPVSGPLAASLATTCRPARPLPVLAMHGTDDPIVPYGGGEIRLRNLNARGEVMSAEAAAELFARADGCTGAPARTREPDRDPSDGTSVDRIAYTCPAGIRVELLAIAGGGHTWPGSTQPTRLGARLVGATSRELSATERIWQFFAATPPRAIR
ncbi:MAG TPA: PHB depolymerase family esterase [Kofleriaceae bacterium]|jgi:polyhydroxybutyrate depolymerase